MKAVGIIWDVDYEEDLELLPAVTVIENTCYFSKTVRL